MTKKLVVVNNNKKANFQVGNYPPGRLPFGFQPKNPQGRNRGPLPPVNYRPYQGKGTMSIPSDFVQKVRGGGGGGGGGGRFGSKFLSMSDMLGNQPFEVAASYGKTNRSKMAKLQADANSCIIAHRELLLPTLPGSTSFSVQLHQNLNPGLSALSSWLAAIAADYEEYEFLEFGLEYVTRSPSNTKGSVGICFDNDPSDPAPATEVEASQMVGTVESNVWKDFVVRANVANMRGNTKRKFVRSGPSLGDIKNFDSGSFSVYTNDCADTSAIGKIWMFYRVRLTTPQSPNSPPVLPATCSQFMSSNTQTVTTAVVTAVAMPSVVFDPLSMSQDVTGVDFTPQKGAYKVTADFSCLDNTGETFSAELFLYKNGAAIGPYVRTASAVPANGGHSMSLSVVCQASGTDIFQVKCLLTGAAGVLTLPANACSVTWSLC